MASIHPRTNKDGSVTYRVLFRVDGRQAQESFTDPMAAARFEKLIDKIGPRAAREARLREFAAEQSHVPTLDAWMSTYLDPDSGLLSGITNGTRDGYLRVAKRTFLEYMGDTTIDLITEETVSAWVNWQRTQVTKRYPDRPVSAKTIKNSHSILSAALRAAVKKGLLDRNPAYGTALPSSRRARIEFLSEEEFAKLYEVTLEFYKPLMLTLAATGMRFGEATALTWGDVVRVGGSWCFDINKAWKQGVGSTRELGEPKSAAGVRLVSVGDEVIHALGTRGKDHQMIFRGREVGPVPPTSFEKFAMRRSLKLAGNSRNVRVHDLRHSHASWLIAKGVPLPYIQRRLGHEKIDTTVSVYGHLMPEMIAATRDAASDAIRLALG